ncbi:UNKNOWN [Stylonychia lemnae]|uniref:Nmda receptor glutamate-binding chain n=1 Tax=Stylonychia lemnae TaxID=5949 RepID=A0A078AGC7_STYLE|nr:UNKNOWN [Stylonychia lemnae]|eukprot:CDW79893.1 UNKNOWN [Stylonychia lemnae]
MNQQNPGAAFAQPTNNYNNQPDYPNSAQHQQQQDLNNQNFQNMPIEAQQNLYKRHASLEELEDRLGFIRKVYGILCAQLLVTVGMCCIPVYNEPTRLWLDQNKGILAIPLVLMITALCFIVCWKKAARTVPWNYLLLLIFTLSMGYIVMFITSQYEPKSVLAAAAITFAVVFGLTLYVYNAKEEIDYSSAGCTIISCALSMACFMMIFSDINRNSTAYCMFGAIMFGFYIVYDTHLIVGGGHYELDSDDYIIAAMIIYMDIINLFLHILRLIGDKK